jgi:hypothetical protein
MQGAPAHSQFSPDRSTQLRPRGDLSLRAHLRSHCVQDEEGLKSECGNRVLTTAMRLVVKFCDGTKNKAFPFQE